MQARRGPPGPDRVDSREKVQVGEGPALAIRTHVNSCSSDAYGIQEHPSRPALRAYHPAGHPVHPGRRAGTRAAMSANGDRVGLGDLYGVMNFCPRPPTPRRVPHPAPADQPTSPVPNILAPDGLFGMIYGALVLRAKLRQSLAWFAGPS